MISKKTRRPTMLEAAHEMAKDLYEINVIDAATMREFDALCLEPVKNAQLQKTRKKMKAIDLDLDDETYKKVQRYMELKNIKSFDEALNKLVDIGLKQKE